MNGNKRPFPQQQGEYSIVRSQAGADQVAHSHDGYAPAVPMSMGWQVANQPGPNQQPPGYAAKATKAAVDPGALISTEMDYDEDRSTGLDQGGEHYYVPKAGRERRLTLQSKTLPIPQCLLDEREAVQYRLHMGVFPEINRAYMTVDGNLFLWTLDGSETVTPYKGLSEPILSAAIVKPKPGVMVPDIMFLLVLATPSEIVILGMVFEDNCLWKPISLYPTKFVVSSDGVHMIKLVGTDNGRIFMCGKDGCVYEVLYQAQDGWFTSKCRKLNHSSSKLQSILPSFLFGNEMDPIVDILVDQARRPQLLFTLSKNSTIQAFVLGETDLTFKAAFPFDSLWKQLKSSRRLLDTPPNKADHFRIVALAPVSGIKHGEVVLMAVTKVGHRLYFSLKTGFNPGLGLCMVRQCPKHTAPTDTHGKFGARQRITQPGYSQTAPQRVRQVFYKNGVLLLADAGVNCDKIVAVVQVDSKAAEENVEQWAWDQAQQDPGLGPETRVHGIVERPQEYYMNSLARCLFARGQQQALVGLSEFSTQHELPSREFLVLTYFGVLTLAKLRPVDELREILAATESHDKNRKMEAFFERYGGKEACAMCLVVACYPNSAVPAPGSTKHSQTIDARAVSSALAVVSPGRRVFGEGQQQALMAEQAQLAFLELGANRVSGARGGQGGQQTTARLRRHHWSSARHAAISLFMSRVLRAVWEHPVCEPRDDKAADSIKLKWTAAWTPQLLRLQSALRNLRVLTEAERLWIKPEGVDQVAFQIDLSALQALQQLLDKCIEWFALLVALAEHPNFHKKLSPEMKTQLKRLKFHELVLKGEKVGQGLVNAVLFAAMHSRGQHSIDTWVDALRQECPTFLGESQMFLYSGDNALRKALGKTNVRARLEECSEALSEYKKAAKMPRFALEDVCGKMRNVRFFVGAADLCMFRAEALDRFEVTLRTAEEVQAEKHKCYQSIEETLNVIFLPDHQQQKEGEESQDKMEWNQQAMDRERDKVVQLVLSSTDPSLHERVYTWFIKAKQTKHLLQIRHPELVRFLSGSDKKEYLMLLKDYLVANQMYADAAHLLSQLPNKVSNEYSLAERHSYLSHALHYARLCKDYGDQSAGDLIFRLRERLELCGVQMAIAEELGKLVEEAAAQGREMEAGAEEGKEGQREGLQAIEEEHAGLVAAAGRLETKLFDINTMYTEYATQYGLWELCLRILQVEGQQDQDRAKVITVLWTNIIRSPIKKHRNEWHLSVKFKIKKLYQQFRADLPMFPLSHIVPDLEDNFLKYTRQDANRLPYEDEPLPAAFVISCLLEAGVHPLDLLGPYTIRMKRDDRSDSLETEYALWSAYHLLKALHDPALAQGLQGRLTPARVTDGSELLWAARHKLRDAGRGSTRLDQGLQEVNNKFYGDRSIPHGPH